ncbi:MAG TPA: ribokinase [Candidatus Marinimicrobia bacterium]|nr:ribokinase [Candidatus Neomarinimicrobiota bacterium]HRS51231.1 ribokinase [Candidatus Neomarinimicrobiota bacterium]HRU91531.1 ribokinase [Candidatus Neomarinimicrobiota bacterium]
MTKNSVIIVGSANMDMMVQVDKYPLPGETVFGKKFGIYPGGKGANQAVACAKLGADTIFIGKMGDDIFRDRLVKNMESNGVNMKEIFIDPETLTGVAFIYVDANGQNEIVVVSGSNMQLTEGDIRSKERLFERAKIVLCQLEIPLSAVETAAALAKKNEATFILNPAPACDLPPNLLRKIDFLIPNEIELSFLTGQAVADRNSVISSSRKLIAAGVRNVITTRGVEGAILVNSERWQEFPAFTVKAVDTTAAGDAFNGAFAAALASGKAVDEAISFANKVAAWSVTKLGAQTSMPTLEDIANF